MSREGRNPILPFRGYRCVIEHIKVVSKFSPTWSCVSLPKPSSRKKTHNMCFIWDKHLQIQMFKILKIIPELINVIHTNKTTSFQVPLLYILRDRVFIMLCSDRSHRLAKKNRNVWWKELFIPWATIILVNLHVLRRFLRQLSIDFLEN